MALDTSKKSEIVTILNKFTYKGVEVFIRKFYDCYEYVFSFDKKIYTQYYQMIPTRKLKDNEQLLDEIKRRLNTIATLTIDKLLQERSPQFKIKKTFKIISNEITSTLRFIGFEPKVKTAASETPKQVQPEKPV